MKKSKFEALAIAVAAGSSIRSAVDSVGCSESYAYTLSAGPEFKQRVSEIRSEITTQAVGRLADSAAIAVDTMRELLGSAFEPSVRLNAAKAILGALPTLSEFGELRSRIDRLESVQQLKVAK